jgi:hypothetical protein
MEIKNNHAISISNNQPGDIIWKIKLDDASKIMVWEIRNSSKNFLLVHMISQNIYKFSINTVLLMNGI